MSASLVWSNGSGFCSGRRLSSSNVYQRRYQGTLQASENNAQDRARLQEPRVRQRVGTTWVHR
jgi:hypothetical protein